MAANIDLPVLIFNHELTNFFLSSKLARELPLTFCLVLTLHGKTFTIHQFAILDVLEGPDKHLGIHKASY